MAQAGTGWISQKMYVGVVGVWFHYGQLEKVFSISLNTQCANTIANSQFHYGRAFWNLRQAPKCKLCENRLGGSDSDHLCLILGSSKGGSTSQPHMSEEDVYLFPFTYQTIPYLYRLRSEGFPLVFWYGMVWPRNISYTGTLEMLPRQHNATGARGS